MARTFSSLLKVEFCCCGRECSCSRSTKDAGQKRHFEISFGKTFLCIMTLSPLSHVAAHSRSLDCMQVIAFLVTHACSSSC